MTFAGKQAIVVNGLPGKMATDVARAVVKSDDFYLYPHSLTGENNGRNTIHIGIETVNLFPPTERRRWLDTLQGDAVIVIDYTSDKTVNEMCELYCSNELPFVMGTTGGDRQALEARVRNSRSVAVIAPNMAPQIVAFQNFMKEYAQMRAGTFLDYKVLIKESHQASKKHTSGTAKSFVRQPNRDAGAFNKLGVEVEEEDIVKIRNTTVQENIGIPREYLNRHGWHFYEFRSEQKDKVTSDKMAEAQFFIEQFSTFLKHDRAFADFEENEDLPFYHSRTNSTNTLKVGFMRHGYSFTPFHIVNGGTPYADGSLLAARFMRNVVSETGKVYSMIDVLNAKD